MGAAVASCAGCEVCARVLQEELRRYNYVTPKNYLDFINNYKRALASNRNSIQVRPAARLGFTRGRL
jgi:hypothetical protein